MSNNKTTPVIPKKRTTRSILESIATKRNARFESAATKALNSIIKITESNDLSEAPVAKKPKFAKIIVSCPNPSNPDNVQAYLTAAEANLSAIRSLTETTVPSPDDANYQLMFPSIQESFSLSSSAPVPMPVAEPPPPQSFIKTLTEDLMSEAPRLLVFNKESTWEFKPQTTAYPKKIINACGNVEFTHFGQSITIGSVNCPLSGTVGLDPDMYPPGRTKLTDQFIRKLSIVIANYAKSNNIEDFKFSFEHRNTHCQYPQTHPSLYTTRIRTSKDDEGHKTVSIHSLGYANHKTSLGDNRLAKTEIANMEWLDRMLDTHSKDTERDESPTRKERDSWNEYFHYVRSGFPPIDTTKPILAAAKDFVSISCANAYTAFVSDNKYYWITLSIPVMAIVALGWSACTGVDGAWRFALGVQTFQKAKQVVKLISASVDFKNWYDAIRSMDLTKLTSDQIRIINDIKTTVHVIYESLYGTNANVAKFASYYVSNNPGLITTIMNLDWSKIGQAILNPKVEITYNSHIIPVTRSEYKQLVSLQEGPDKTLADKFADELMALREKEMKTHSIDTHDLSGTMASAINVISAMGVSGMSKNDLQLLNNQFTFMNHSKKFSEETFKGISEMLSAISRTFFCCDPYDEEHNTYVLNVLEYVKYATDQVADSLTLTGDKSRMRTLMRQCMVGVELLNNIRFNALPRGIQHKLSQCSSDLTHLSKKACEALKLSHSRVEPVAIMFCGPPGIGKSSAVKELMNYLDAAHDWPRDDNQRFYYQAASPFFDGYCDQNHTCVDDAWQEITPEIRERVSKNLIDMINVMSTILNMAYDKGYATFKSKYVYVTTNCAPDGIDHSEWRLGIEDNNAVLRRFPFAVWDKTRLMPGEDVKKKKFRLDRCPEHLGNYKGQWMYLSEIASLMKREYDRRANSRTDYEMSPEDMKAELEAAALTLQGRLVVHPDGTRYEPADPKSLVTPKFERVESAEDVIIHTLSLDAAALPADIAGDNLITKCGLEKSLEIFNLCCELDLYSWNKFSTRGTLIALFAISVAAYNWEGIYKYIFDWVGGKKDETIDLTNEPDDSPIAQATASLESHAAYKKIISGGGAGDEARYQYELNKKAERIRMSKTDGSGLGKRGGVAIHSLSTNSAASNNETTYKKLCDSVITLSADASMNGRNFGSSIQAWHISDGMYAVSGHWYYKFEGASNIVCTAELRNMRIKIPFPTRYCSVTDTDIILIRLHGGVPKTMPIINYMMKADDARDIPDGYPLRVVGYYFDGKEDINVSAAKLKVGNPYNFHMGNKPITLSVYLPYRLNSVAGWSNSMVTVVDHQGNIKIVGNHVGQSGAKGELNTSVACLLIKESFESAINLFKQDEAEPIVEPLTTESYAHQPSSIDNLNTLSSDKFPLKVKGIVEKALFHSPYGKTRLIKSPLYGCFISPLYKPAHLTPFARDGVVINPGYVALGKMVQDPESAIDVDVDRVFGWLDSFYRTTEMKPVLTLEQAINRWSDWFPSVSTTTSSGFPTNKEKGVKGKSPYINIDLTKDLPFSPTQRLIAEVDEFMHLLKRGIVPEVIYCDTLKDELRTNEKVDEGKSRLISSGPFKQTCPIRMLCGAFISHVQSLSDRAPVSVGIVPHSIQWTRLGNEVGSYKSVIAGDYTNWDGKVHSKLIELFVEYMNHWYDDGEEFANMRRTLGKTIMNGTHVFEDKLYQVTAGNPSGNGLTSILNSFVNCMMLYTVFTKDLKLMEDQFVIRCYGDDNLNGVDIDGLRCSDISGHLKKRFNADYTHFSKASGADPVDTIWTVEYIARAFVPHNDGTQGVILRAPIKRHILWEILCYVRSKVDFDHRLLSSIDCFVTEWTHYPRKEWQVAVDRMLEQLKVKMPHLVEPARAIIQSYYYYYDRMYGTGSTQFNKIIVHNKDLNGLVQKWRDFQSEDGINVRSDLTDALFEYGPEYVVGENGGIEDSDLRFHDIDYKIKAVEVAKKFAAKQNLFPHSSDRVNMQLVTNEDGNLELPGIGITDNDALFRRNLIQGVYDPEFAVREAIRRREEESEDEQETWWYHNGARVYAEAGANGADRPDTPVGIHIPEHYIGARLDSRASTPSIEYASPGDDKEILMSTCNTCDGRAMNQLNALLYTASLESERMEEEIDLEDNFDTYKPQRPLVLIRTLITDLLHVYNNNAYCIKDKVDQCLCLMCVPIDNRSRLIIPHSGRSAMAVNEGRNEALTERAANPTHVTQMDQLGAFFDNCEVGQSSGGPLALQPPSNSINFEAFDNNHAVDRLSDLQLVSWPSTTAAGVALSSWLFPDELFIEDYISAIGQFYQDFACDGIRISFRVISNETQSGNLICEFNPMNDIDAFPSTDQTAAAGNMHVRVSATSSEAVIFDVPWVNIRRMISVTGFASGTLGKVTMWVGTPLRSVNATPGTVKVLVSAQFINGRFYIPRNVGIAAEDFELVKQKRPDAAKLREHWRQTSARDSLKQREKDMKEGRTIVTHSTEADLKALDHTISDSLIRVSNAAGSVGLTSIGAVAGAAGRVASAVGYSKPGTLARTDVVNPNPFRGFATGKGVSDAEPLAIDNQSCISTVPNVGGVGRDEMSLKAIAMTPSLSGQYTLTPTTANLIFAGFNPNFSTRLPICNQVALKFRWYNTTTKVKCYFTATKFHKIDVVIWYQDSPSETVPYTDCYHNVVSITGDTEYEFSIPHNDPHVVKDSATTGGGFMFLSVLSWSTPDPAYGTAIGMDVYVAFDDDCQFWCATDNVVDLSYSATFETTGDNLETHSGLSVVVSSPREAFKKPFPMFHPSMKKYQHHGFIAEEVKTVLELIHANEYDVLTTAGGTVTIPAWNAAGQYAGAIYSGMEMWGLFFRFWRGSIRHGFINPNTWDICGATLLNSNGGKRMRGFVLTQHPNPNLEVQIPYYSNLLFQSTSLSTTNAIQYVTPQAVTKVLHHWSAGDDMSYHWIRRPPTNTTIDIDGPTKPYSNQLMITTLATAGNHLFIPTS